LPQALGFPMGRMVNGMAVMATAPFDPFVSYPNALLAILSLNRS
jgi:hypothetical protein